MQPEDGMTETAATSKKEKRRPGRKPLPPELLKANQPMKLPYNADVIKAVSGGYFVDLATKEEARKKIGIRGADSAWFNAFDTYVLLCVLAHYSIADLCRFLGGVNKISHFRGKMGIRFRHALADSFRKINDLQIRQKGEWRRICVIDGDWKNCCNWKIAYPPPLFPSTGTIVPEDFQIGKRHSLSHAALGMTLLMSLLCGAWQLRPEHAKWIEFASDDRNKACVWRNWRLIRRYMRKYAADGRMRCYTGIKRKWTESLYRDDDDRSGRIIPIRPPKTLDPEGRFPRKCPPELLGFSTFCGSQVEAKAPTVIRLDDNSPLSPAMEAKIQSKIDALLKEYYKNNAMIWRKNGWNPPPFEEAVRKPANSRGFSCRRPFKQDNRDEYRDTTDVYLEMRRRTSTLLANTPGVELRLGTRMLFGKDVVRFRDARFETPTFESRLDHIAPSRLRDLRVNGLPGCIVDVDCPHALFVDSLRKRPLAADWAEKAGFSLGDRERRRWENAICRVFLETFRESPAQPQISRRMRYQRLRVAIHRISGRWLGGKECGRLFNAVIPLRTSGAFYDVPCLSAYRHFRGWALLNAALHLREHGIAAVATERGLAVRVAASPAAQFVLEDFARVFLTHRKCATWKLQLVEFRNGVARRFRASRAKAAADNNGMVLVA